jgi:hypothetical protein
MDRDTVIMPQMQLGFINSICFPMFKMLANFSPELSVGVENLKDNMTEWNRILKQGLTKIKST